MVSRKPRLSILWLFLGWNLLATAKYTFLLTCEAFVVDYKGPRRRVLYSSASAPTRLWTTTTRHLFFRTADDALLSAGTDEWKVPDRVYQELACANVSFPYRYVMEPSTAEPEDNEKAPTITIRPMQTQDLEAVSVMCFAEYSRGPVSLDDIPWESLTWAKAADIYDRFLDYYTLPWLVDLTMRMKILGGGDPSSIPVDHAVLVATTSSSLKEDDKEQVIGLVEVSRQPDLPERNPPPFPFPPLWMKQLFCRFKGIGCEGWVTNLLIQPRYRGRKLSKVLMAAVEGVARQWNVRSVSLHADADESSGRISQQLYLGLSYKPLADEQQAELFSWMGPSPLSSSVFVIEDVPLLYLKKVLR